MFFQHANTVKKYTKPMQLPNLSTFECIMIYFAILYFSDFRINNDAIFRSILQFCEISRPLFLYSKRLTDEFLL